MKLTLALVLAVVVASAATTANAATKTYQDDPRLDAIASGIAGFPLTVTGDDDSNEWAQLVASLNINCPGCTTVGGFAFPFAFPGNSFYRKVFIGPPDWANLEAIENLGIANVDPYQAAGSVLLRAQCCLSPQAGLARRGSRQRLRAASSSPGDPDLFRRPTDE